MLKQLSIFLIVRGPKLDIISQVYSDQSHLQRDNYFPSPTGQTISDTSQDDIGILSHLGTQVVDVQPAINNTKVTEGLFLQSNISVALPQPCMDSVSV